MEGDELMSDVKMSTKKILYHTDELKDLGLSLYKVNQLVEKGILLKLSKSYYENNVYSSDESDFYYVKAFAREGVVCLLSAAVYYGLSNHMPDFVDVAVRSNTRISTTPEWPPMKFYYFNEQRHTLGLEEVIIGENSFKIYDIEKTVIDIISFRNKVGIDAVKEILSNYLRLRSRNINKLIRYSKSMRCYSLLSKYLEVLL
jgi:predicted transcriptional regulator of viral defense system